MVEILEPAADLGARGRFRDKRDVESGEPPVLAVDEDVSIDPMLFDLVLEDGHWRIHEVTKTHVERS
jgi:hypothetical protein